MPLGIVNCSKVNCATFFKAQALERKKGNYCKERLWYEIAAQSSPPFVIRMRASVLRSNLAIYGFILTQPYMYYVQFGRLDRPTVLAEHYSHRVRKWLIYTEAGSK